jgi:hypothetical protein
VGALQLVDEVGALPCGAHGESLWQKLVGHIVAGQKHRIGNQTVDVVDGVAEQERLSKFVQVDIAELRHAKTVEGGGKAGEKYVAARDLDSMLLDLARIKRQASAGTRTCSEEAAPRDVQIGESFQQCSIFRNDFQLDGMRTRLMVRIRAVLHPAGAA